MKQKQDVQQGTLALMVLKTLDVLLGAQIAICMLLVTASLVAVRGMVRMVHPSLLGFEPQGAMLAGVTLSQSPRGGDVPLETKRSVIEAVRDIPGVTAAGAADRVPLSGGGLRGVPVYHPGTAELTLDSAAMAPYLYTISPGYLDAAGTRGWAGVISHGGTRLGRRLYQS